MPTPNPRAPPRSPSPPSQSGLAEVVNEQNFHTLINSEIPVIFECYSDWYEGGREACRELAPMLATVVSSAKGKIKHVRLNLDTHQGLGQSLEIRAIPTVLAIRQKTVIDMFVGVLPMEELKAFVSRLVQTSNSDDKSYEGQLKQGSNALQQKNVQVAAKFYNNVLLNKPQKHSEENKDKETKEYKEWQAYAARATAGLVRCALLSNRVNEATELVSSIKSNPAFKTALKHPEIVQAIRALDLFSIIQRELDQYPLKTMDQAGRKTAYENESQKLLNLLQNDPDQHSSRYSLAVLLFEQGKPDQAMDHLLQLLKRSKNWASGARDARQLLMLLFEWVGHENPFVKQARKQLTNLLL